MKIIIFGANDIGVSIALQHYLDNDITFIDKEANKVESINKLDISFIDGLGSDINVLNQADISDANFFIACTSSDELNIIACLTAKKIGNVSTICFVKNEGYKASMSYAKEAEYNCDFYVDYVIYPKELLAQEIFRIITVAKALDVENFANGKARLLEYKIAENSVLVDKTIRHCQFPKDTLIVGINRDKDLFIPNGETVLQKNDKVIFMGLSDSLDVLAGKFFHDKSFIKNVVIIGGGSIGLNLAKKLEELKLDIKIIEQDANRCEHLAENLENTLVIHGDGTDIELLNEEDISLADVLISVTNNDEKNLLCSLMAKQLGVSRVISRVSKDTNLSLFEKVGIDVAVSSKMAALNEVKNNLFGKDCGILATVEQGKGEILEIVLPADFVPQKIMDLGFPHKAIIGVIQRRNRIIIPNGTTQVMPDDRLIIFTTSMDAQAIKKFFKVK